MRKAIDIIKEGQQKLERLGLETKIRISDPQLPEDIAKIEKKFKMAFPEDYKEFVTQHGVVSVLLGGAESESNQMLDMESIAEETIDLREDLLDSSDLPNIVVKNIVPFQYIIDDLLEEYYVFRINPQTREIDIHDLDEDWNRLTNYRNKYASSFTEHIGKFVESLIKKAKTFEKKSIL